MGFFDSLRYTNNTVVDGLYSFCMKVLEFILCLQIRGSIIYIYIFFKFNSKNMQKAMANLDDHSHFNAK